jgi:hypothetical protein
MRSLLKRSQPQPGWLRLPARGEQDVAVKPEPYLSIYEQLLGPLRNEAFTMLELGVWKGDSLEMWRDAFPRATIVGVDLQPPPLELGPRVHIVRGDQTDRELMARVRSLHAPKGFDLIIDDASHIGAVTARSLQVLYADHLRPGGLYCIEDWGTGYLTDWPDGGPLVQRLETAALDAPSAGQGQNGDAVLPSHALGMVGLAKRLIDHAARKTIAWAQPDAVGEALEIEQMCVWDGIVALRKPGTR